MQKPKQPPPTTPSKTKPRSNVTGVQSSPSSTNVAVMFWLFLWILASIGYVFSTSIILRSLPDDTIETDMYALSIGQTSVNTFISAIFYLFIGRRVPLTANPKKSNSLKVITSEDIELSISKGKIIKDKTGNDVALSSSSKKSSDSKAAGSSGRFDIKKDLSPIVKGNHTTSASSSSSSDKSNKSKSSNSISSSPLPSMPSRKNVHAEQHRKDNNKSLQIVIDKCSHHHPHALDDVDDKDEENDDTSTREDKSPLLSLNASSLSSPLTSSSSDKGYFDWLHRSFSCCSGVKTWTKRTNYSDMLVMFVGVGRIANHIASLVLLRYTEVSFAEVFIFIFMFFFFSFNKFRVSKLALTICFLTLLI
jgi:hypothetical protein